MGKATNFLNALIESSSPELVEKWEIVRQLYDKKLWHQLTLVILDLMKSGKLSGKNVLVSLYEELVADFEHRINLLSLMEMAALVVTEIEKYNDAMKYLESMKTKVKANPEATCLCVTIMAAATLDHAHHLQLSKSADQVEIKKRIDEVKELLREADKLFDDIPTVGSVHSRYYETSSKYHRLVGNHADYYRDALRYLGCVDLAEIPENEQKERAYSLCLAALLGEGVYNFGELLQHDILESLKKKGSTSRGGGTDMQWLVDLLFAFNSGNLAKLYELEPKWKEQADLKAQEMLLRQKICLLCLMEMSFKRPANRRQLSFKEIARETRLPMDEVELLVMKALSRGLVRGHIDQVDQLVHITWIQPRVLDKQQLKTMNDRFSAWAEEIKSMEGFVKDEATEILT